jgi:hypothetical protein
MEREIDETASKRNAYCNGSYRNTDRKDIPALVRNELHPQ